LLVFGKRPIEKNLKLFFLNRNFNTKSNKSRGIIENKKILSGFVSSGNNWPQN
jgi:hypothetical protein